MEFDSPRVHQKTNMDQNKYFIYRNHLKLARLLLRFGLAFVFSYASLEMFLDPSKLMIYIPEFITRIVSTDFFLFSFGLVEVLLALWLVSGYKVRYAAIISFFLMAGFVGFNLDQFHILFRNIAIGLAAIALALIEEAEAVIIN